MDNEKNNTSEEFEEEEKNAEEQANEEQNAEQEEKKEKTFSQAQVNRMMAKEKREGKNSVYRELGLNPGDSKMIAMFKAFVDSQKSDEEKQKEQDNEMLNNLNAANERALVAELKAEVMMAGIKSNYVDDAVSLIRAKMTDDTDVKSILTEFKTKYSIWFSESEEQDKKKDGTGNIIKNNQSDKKDGKKTGFAARLAAQKRVPTDKKSYWGS